MYRNLLNYLLMSPESDDGGGTSVEDMIDLMGSDDNPDEDKDKVLTDIEGDLLEDEKKDDKEEKDEKEEIKLEETDEDKEIDEEELDDNFDGINRKELLKAYPDLFKKFPQLEKAYYREQKYAELLPTIEDAKLAVEKSTTYDNFENSLLDGNLDVIIKSVKDSDQKAYGKIIDGYLPQLMKVDKDAYHHVLGTVIKNTIISMVREGNNIKNDKLKEAATIVHQFIFGSSEWKPPSSFSGASSDPQISEQEQRLQGQRAEFIKEKFDSALEGLHSSSQNIVKSTISQHIDPKNVMTDYVKKVAIKDAVVEVDELIQKDARFKSIINKLWERAFERNFDKVSTDNIKKAYLNKAKTLLPPIISKHRNAALKGLGKRVTENKEEVTKKGPISVGRTAGADNTSKGKEVPRGMKTLDYLMQD